MYYVWHLQRRCKKKSHYSKSLFKKTIERNLVLFTSGAFDQNLRDDPKKTEKLIDEGTKRLREKGTWGRRDLETMRRRDKETKRQRDLKTKRLKDKET